MRFTILKIITEYQFYNKFINEIYIDCNDNFDSRIRECSIIKVDDL